MYQRFGRTMPASNRAQAYFPAGTNVIPNPEGTAPGIDLIVRSDDQFQCRVIALPGVPAELKQMWEATVAQRINEITHGDLTFDEFTVHCFGLGESTIESMLPDLVRRGRDPKVGITASAATITLRVSTQAPTKGECQLKMADTVNIIRDTLGDLVFGINGQTLEGAVLTMIRLAGQTIAIDDEAFDGGIVDSMKCRDAELDLGDTEIVVKGHWMDSRWKEWDGLKQAKKVRSQFGTDFGLSVSPINTFEPDVVSGNSYFDVVLVGPAGHKQEKLRYGGHSGWRKQRGIKQVLNFIRLNLLSINGHD